MTYHNHFAGLGDSFTLSHCRKLRELEITLPLDTMSAGLDFISSITSIHIQKIIVTCSFASQELPVNDTYWTHLDDVLCWLVDRPEYRLQLEVEFLTASHTWVEELGLKVYLSRFHKKGQVMVVGPESEGIYCSYHCPGI